MIITGDSLAQVRRLSEAAVALATPMGAEVVSATSTLEYEEIVLHKPDRSVPQRIVILTKQDDEGPWLDVRVEPERDRGSDGEET